jgi:hypothetical protein
MLGQSIRFVCGYPEIDMEFRMKWDRVQHTLKSWSELTGNHLEGDCGREQCPDGQGSGGLAHYLIRSRSADRAF